VRYHAGWNLVGGPAGTVFGASGPLYSPGAGATGYEAKPGDAPAEAGHGYWASFAADTTVVLNSATVSSLRVNASPGQWVLVGNPNDAQAIFVTGADTLLTWDTTAGRYVQVAELAAGQGAWALAEKDGSGVLTLQAAPAIAKGALLFADDYSTPAAGRLPVTPFDCCTRSYENGEYVLRVIDPAATSIAGADLPGGDFTDTVLTVDARLVGDTEGRYVSLACRAGENGNYRLLIDGAGHWSLRYLHLELDIGAGISWVLAGGDSPAIHPGTQSNHIELACVGNNIQASVNGTVIVALTHDSLRSGASTITAGTYTDSGTDRTVEARFVNVTLYRGVVAAAAPLTGVTSKRATCTSSSVVRREPLPCTAGGQASARPYPMTPL
jgi:hypothetical protein